MDQPSKVKAWLYAFRLRTLPLSFSCIIVGSFIAYHQQFSWLVLGLALLTTLLLQVLSNLANDYGDSEKGTDNDDRIGPKRAIQAGILSFSEIRTAIIVCGAVCLLSGCGLIYVSLQEQAIPALIFLAVGIGAIVAALKYTIGSGAYGYHGMGDVFVLLFFGLVGVGGSYYLQSHTLDLTVLLPGVAVGCFATGVLNLNNMRDRIGDAKAGKNTIVVKMGDRNARIYHTLLLTIGWAAAIAFVAMHLVSSVAFVFILTMPLFWRNVIVVWRVKEPRDFDPYLPQLAISTFLFAVLFAAGQVWNV
ncbi:MAG: 1,4-dihydroxy-2-naphthoate polyprenyltransferase [Bacteroidetes bacterium]|nr:1,4-dihydroxy-2-naphthoate polyprenyltransferase [Bacteroidota bacterium]